MSVGFLFKIGKIVIDLRKKISNPCLKVCDSINSKIFKKPALTSELFLLSTSVNFLGIFASVGVIPRVLRNTGFGESSSKFTYNYSNPSAAKTIDIPYVTPIENMKRKK